MRKKTEYCYSSMTNILREQILSGYIKQDEFLMSENELSKYYEVSRTSVRKSLDQLLKEGLIVKKPGLGTLISPNVVIQKNKRKVLRILANSPSIFVDHCMPIVSKFFQERYKHVDITLLSFPNDQFWDSFYKCIEMGIQPDLVITTNQLFQALESTDDFVGLERVLNKTLSSIYPNLVDPFRENDSIKAVPVTFSTVCLAYNPNLFDNFKVERPHSLWTKEDFIRIAEQLTHDTNDDGIIDIFGFSLTSTFNRWPVIAMQNGFDFNKPHNNKKALLETLNLIHDMLYRQRIAISPHLDLQRRAFSSQKLAMMLTSIIELAGIREQLPFEPHFAPLPFGDFKSTMLLANAIMMHSACSDRELAVQFLETVCHPEVQEKMGMSHFLSILHPINEKLWERSQLESFNIVEGKIENAYFEHDVLKDHNARTVISEEMKLYWEGLESSTQFATRLQNIITGRKKRGLKGTIK